MTRARSIGRMAARLSVALASAFVLMLAAGGAYLILVDAIARTMSGTFR